MDYVMSIEEVDTALFDKLNGLTIDNKPVPVTYYDPDVEITQREEGVPEGYYPRIVLYRQSEQPNYERWSHDLIKDNHVYSAPDPVTGVSNLTTIDVRQPPEPWDVYYSVRLIAEYQQDLVAMKQFYRRNFPLRGNYLAINGAKYDIFHVGNALHGGGFKEFGAMNNGKREFGDGFLIRIEISLDIYERETKNVVDQIGINVNQIP